MHRARELWRVYEPIHIVTYFSPEAIQAAKDAGLKGFWMGYFGFRAAPLGPVPAGVVKATFANFAPDKVDRAVPDCWKFCSPEDLIDPRAESAAAALARMAPSIASVPARAAELLERVIHGGDPLGRPLFAANALLTRENPIERLWQACTTVREHRGDGHVAVLASEGISGPQAHQLLIAERGFADEPFLLARGFPADAWEEARSQLQDRQLLTEDRTLTAAGAALRTEIERRTDELSMTAFATLSSAEHDDLIAMLSPIANEIQATGEIPSQNPIGL